MGQDAGKKIEDESEGKGLVRPHVEKPWIPGEGAQALSKMLLNWGVTCWTVYYSENKFQEKDRSEMMMTLFIEQYRSIFWMKIAYYLLSNF